MTVASALVCTRTRERETILLLLSQRSLASWKRSTILENQCSTSWLVRITAQTCWSFVTAGAKHEELLRLDVLNFDTRHSQIQTHRHSVT